MRSSLIVALAVLILLIAMAAFVLPPHERAHTSSLPGPLWASRP